MTTSIYKAFVKAQSEFECLTKDANNPHFKSKYADLASCVDAVIGALNKNGIALIQKVHPDSSGVTVETVLIHEDGGEISGGLLHVPAAKQDPQGYGSALTYARRYSLMSTCGIAPEDDDGNTATNAVKDQRHQAARKAPVRTAAKEPTPTPTLELSGNVCASLEAIDALNAMIKRVGANVELIKKFYGVTELVHLSETQAAEATGQLAKRLAAK